MPAIRVMLIRGPTDSFARHLCSTMVDTLTIYEDGGSDDLMYMPRLIEYFSNDRGWAPVRTMTDCLAKIRQEIKEIKAKVYDEDGDDFVPDREILLIVSDDISPIFIEKAEQLIHSLLADDQYSKFVDICVKGDMVNWLNDKERVKKYAKDIEAFYV